MLAGLASFAQGYLAAGNIQMTRGLLAFGALWTFAQIRRWLWFPPFGLFVSLMIAGYGLWTGLSVPWMFAGALGALFAWDLSDFQHRLQDSAPEDASALIQRHLLRLGLLAAAGLASSGLRMLYWWRIFQDGLVYVAILSALGVGLLVGRLRRGTA